MKIFKTLFGIALAIFGFSLFALLRPVGLHNLGRLIAKLGGKIADS